VAAGWGARGLVAFFAGAFSGAAAGFFAGGVFAAGFFAAAFFASAGFVGVAAAGVGAFGAGFEGFFATAGLPFDGREGTVGPSVGKGGPDPAFGPAERGPYRGST
jgi:hypothetical protein